jgi:hypothetical protein
MGDSRRKDHTRPFRAARVATAVKRATTGRSIGLDEEEERVGGISPHIGTEVPNKTPRFAGSRK